MSDRSITFDNDVIAYSPPVKPYSLKMSQFNRPIVYIAEWFYTCVPSAAVPHSTCQCVFSTQEQAVLWCKFEMNLHHQMDWSKWKPNANDPSQYEYNDGREFCFHAEIEGYVETKVKGVIKKERWSAIVSVRRTEVCGKFDWAAGGDAAIKARCGL